MRTMKRQIALLSVLMVLIIAALTLGGLQLFGKGKVKPSEWFKKADKPQVEQTAPEMASFMRGALFAENDISLISEDETREDKTMSVLLKCNGQITPYIPIFSGYQITRLVTGGQVGDSYTNYSFYLTCDASQYIGLGYTNFRLSGVYPSTWSFSREDNILCFSSYSMNDVSVDFLISQFQSGAYIDCDLVRVEVPLPATPTKEGHTFAGWYYGTETEHGSNCNAYDGQPIYEDTNLHAHWTVNTYTVTFDSAGGSAVESKTVNWNTAVSLSDSVRVGYTFKGWYLADGTKYESQVIKTNTTLTAHWEIKTFKVMFYVDGELYNETTVEFGTKLVDAMEAANIVSYMAMTTEGIRLSKQSSVITEDTQVVVRELTGWEKYGDFVARNQWYTWTLVGIGGVLLILAVVGIVEMVRKR